MPDINAEVAEGFEVAIVAKLRNGPMVRFRQSRGLTQAAAARECGIPHNTWNRMECMRFERVPVGIETIAKIAAYVDVEPQGILPPAANGKNLGATRVMYRRLEVVQLVYAERTAERLLLPAPNEIAEQREAADSVEAILWTLTYHEREIIKLRYGLGDGDSYGYSYTLEETARIFKVTRERVRQVEAKAIRKLQNPIRASRLRGLLDA